MSDTLHLAQQLINIQSITPNDGGCQNIIADILKSAGFEIEHVNSNAVSNLYAQRGNSAPLIIFSGHTDVVPPGPEEKWRTPPFQASIRHGQLVGRGAADMKGALSAMVIGAKRFIETHPEHAGSIAFMITSDEEGDATDGTIKLVEHLQAKGLKPDYCIIGEASSNHNVGDAIKIGRRGSLHGALQVIGKQGHIAYPQLADNPIHRSFKALDALTNTEWDQGNEHFSPTSLQIYNINADTGATNVIPGSLSARFNFRFSPSSTSKQLQQRVHEVLDSHNLEYRIKWNLSSQPFLSKPGKLLDACKAAIQAQCNLEPDVNTAGGTSDGRFIATTNCEIIELGAVGKCIHQVNEHINIEDLDTLTQLYKNILERVLLT